MSDIGAVATIFLGALGSLGVLICITKERNYRKARKALLLAESKDFMSPKEAINLVKFTKKKQCCYVSGIVKSLDSSKTVYVESRPRYLSLSKLNLVDYPDAQTITSSRFLLTDSSSSIVLSPYQLTISFGLEKKSQKFTGFMQFFRYALLLSTIGTNLPFSLFDINLSLNDGDYITAFGTLSYNVRTRAIEMTKAKYLLKGSKRDLVNYLQVSANAKWWTVRIVELITVGIVGYFGYRAYRLFEKWEEARVLRQRNRNPSVIVVHDIMCAVCHAEYRTVTYKDCNHLAVCNNCDQRNNYTNCPICNQAIRERSVLYLA